MPGLSDVDYHSCKGIWVIIDEILQLLLHMHFRLHEHTFDEEDSARNLEVGISPTSSRYSEMDIQDGTAAISLDKHFAMVSACHLVVSTPERHGGNRGLHHKVHLREWCFMDLAWHHDDELLNIVQISRPTRWGWVRTALV